MDVHESKFDISDMEAAKCLDLMALGTTFEISSALFKAAEERQVAGQLGQAAALSCLAGLFSMRLCSNNPSEPFEPYWTIGGDRSLLPQDLAESPLNILEEFVKKVEFSSSRARLCDVLWLRRRQLEFGRSAINSYLSFIDSEGGDFGGGLDSAIIRALQIARQLRVKSAEMGRAVDAASR